MKPDPTISTQKFVSLRGKYTLALRKQSSTEQYPIKSFLDQLDIEMYLPTYQDDIRITQKYCLAKICDQILFFCQVER